MKKNEFTSKLYFEVSKKGKHPFDIYGEIFGKVFHDVRVYSGAFASRRNVSELTGGKYQTLGEFFEKAHQHGIFNTWPDTIITNLDFNICLYDAGFKVQDIEYHDELYQGLMKPEYQKRYILEMYKIFGEPYKKHYKEIIQEKRKRLEEEEEFIK